MEPAYFPSTSGELACTLFCLWFLSMMAYTYSAEHLSSAPYKNHRKHPHVTTNLVFGNMLGGLPLVWAGFSPQYFDKPAIAALFVKLVLCVLAHDAIFHALHRLFHHRLLYKPFHKLHHQWVNPVPDVAFDATLVEHVVVNVLPVVMLGIYLDMNVVETAVWYCLATAGSVSGHVKGTSHALHHADVKCNFGTGLMLVDRLTGTFK